MACPNDLSITAAIEGTAPLVAAHARIARNFLARLAPLHDVPAAVQAAQTLAAHAARAPHRVRLALLYDNHFLLGLLMTTPHFRYLLGKLCHTGNLEPLERQALSAKFGTLFGTSAYYFIDAISGNLPPQRIDLLFHQLELYIECGEGAAPFSFSRDPREWPVEHQPFVAGLDRGTLDWADILAYAAVNVPSVPAMCVWTAESPSFEEMVASPAPRGTLVMEALYHLYPLYWLRVQWQYLLWGIMVPYGFTNVTIAFPHITARSDPTAWFDINACVRSHQEATRLELRVDRGVDYPEYDSDDDFYGDHYEPLNPPGWDAACEALTELCSLVEGNAYLVNATTVDAQLFFVNDKETAPVMLPCRDVRRLTLFDACTGIYHQGCDILLRLCDIRVPRSSRSRARELGERLLEYIVRNDQLLRIRQADYEFVCSYAENRRLRQLMYDEMADYQFVPQAIPVAVAIYEGELQAADSFDWMALVNQIDALVKCQTELGYLRDLTALVVGICDAQTWKGIVSVITLYVSSLSQRTDDYALNFKWVVSELCEQLLEVAQDLCFRQAEGESYGEALLRAASDVSGGFGKLMWDLVSCFSLSGPLIALGVFPNAEKWKEFVSNHVTPYLRKDITVDNLFDRFFALISRLGEIVKGLFQGQALSDLLLSSTPTEWLQAATDVLEDSNVEVSSSGGFHSERDGIRRKFFTAAERARRVHELVKEGERLLQRVVEWGKNPVLGHAISNQLARLRACASKWDMRAMGAGSRRAPLVIMIHGAPGIGKTEMIKSLHPVLMGAIGYPTSDSCIHLYRAGAKHYDGYNASTNAVWFDDNDKFPVKADGENTWVVAFHNIANSNPNLLPMADLPDKGKYYSDVPVVYITTNHANCNLRGLTHDVQAFWRRVSVHVSASLKPEFQVSATEPVLNVAAMDGPFDPRPWNFVVSKYSKQEGREAEVPHISPIGSFDCKDALFTWIRNRFVAHHEREKARLEATIGAQQCPQCFLVHPGRPCLQGEPVLQAEDEHVLREEEVEAAILSGRPVEGYVAPLDVRMDLATVQFDALDGSSRLFLPLAYILLAVFAVSISLPYTGLGFFLLSVAQAVDSNIRALFPLAYQVRHEGLSPWQIAGVASAAAGMFMGVPNISFLALCGAVGYLDYHFPEASGPRLRRATVAYGAAIGSLILSKMAAVSPLFVGGASIFVCAPLAVVSWLAWRVPAFRRRPRLIWELVTLAAIHPFTTVRVIHTMLFTHWDQVPEGYPYSLALRAYARVCVERARVETASFLAAAAVLAVLAVGYRGYRKYNERAARKRVVKQMDVDGDDTRHMNMGVPSAWNYPTATKWSHLPTAPTLGEPHKTTSFEQMCTMVRGYTARISVQVGSGQKRTVDMLRYRGNLYVVPYHVFNGLTSVEASCVTYGAPASVLRWEGLLQEGVHYVRVAQKDQAILAVPGFSSQGPGVSKLVAPSSQFAFQRQLDEAKLISARLDQDFDVMPWRADVKAFDEQTPTSHWAYLAPTEVGVCGAPLVVRRGSYAWVAGIHRLGNQMGQAFAEELVGLELESSAMVLEASPLGVSVQAMDFTSDLGHRAEVVLAPLHEKSVMHYAVKSSALVLGTAVTLQGKPVHRSKDRSHVRPTSFGQEFRDELESMGTVFTAPTFGGRINSQGEYVHPVGRRLEALGKTAKMPSSIMNWALHDYLKGAELLPGARSFRPLTEAETFAGVPGSTIGGFEKETSAGFPFFRKKSSLYPEGWQVENPEVEAMKVNILSVIDSGRAFVPVVSGSLKDETLKIEKERDGKVRLFFSMPFAFNFLLKQYLAPLLAFMACHKTFFESFVGANAVSPMATYLVDHVTQFGEFLLDFDTEDCDSTVPPEFCREVQPLFFATLAQLCGYNERDVKRVRFLVHSLQQVHLWYKGDIITLVGHNWSGSLITVWTNILFLAIAFRMCLLVWAETNDLQLFEGLRKHKVLFRMLVANMLLGDDTFMGTHPRIRAMDFNCFKSLMAQFGIRVKPGDKGDEQRPFKTLAQVSFLKRRFVFDARLGHYAARLELSSILKSLAFAGKTAISHKDQESQIIESALREFFLYGEEEYTRRREQLERLAMANGLQPRFNTYDDLLRDFAAGKFLTWVPL